MLRVLHITPWFPSAERPKEALWIRNHIEALDAHTRNEVLHIQSEEGKWRYVHKLDGRLRSVKLQAPLRSWYLREILISIILLYVLLRYYPARHYPIWNFHIAYPNLVWLIRLKKWFGNQWVITEHWSYYHFHFYSQKPLKRVKSIFAKNIPLMVVSQVLAADIEQFSAIPQSSTVIPNAVDTSVFKYNPQVIPEEHFFSIAFWKSPKEPLSMLRAVRALRQSGKEIKLRIGGYGPQWEDMQRECNNLGLTEAVSFIGPLDPRETAREMLKARAFILPSAYETFSVVCAEALCCGCPLIVSRSGALPELVSPGMNGSIVESNDWKAALGDFPEYNAQKREGIAGEAALKYDKDRVGAQYFSFLKGQIH